MPHAWRNQPRPPRRGQPVGPAAATRTELLPVVLDLRRADLYRILDAFARAPPEGRDVIVREFEEAWEDFKEAVARSS